MIHQFHPYWVGAGVAIHARFCRFRTIPQILQVPAGCADPADPPTTSCGYCRLCRFRLVPHVPANSGGSDRFYRVRQILWIRPVPQDSAESCGFLRILLDSADFTGFCWVVWGGGGVIAYAGGFRHVFASFRLRPAGFCRCCRILWVLPDSADSVAFCRFRRVPADPADSDRSCSFRPILQVPADSLGSAESIYFPQILQILSASADFDRFCWIRLVLQVPHVPADSTNSDRFLWFLQILLVPTDPAGSDRFCRFCRIRAVHARSCWFP